MKYAFWRCLTVILMVLSGLDITYAQLVNSFTGESPAVTCQPNGAETVVTITNGATALTNATISIQLGVGIQILPTMVQSLSGPSVSLTGINLNAPAFTVASWPANSTLKFSFRKKALCAARTQKVNGGGFQDVISIKNSSGATLNILGTKTITYDIIYASLSITSQTTTPVSINPGQTATRSMTISNGSFGQLEEFLFADITSAGKFTYSDFRLNPSSTNRAIPVSAISTSGDSLKVKFDKAIIKLIGDGDETFELNENFVLQYKITVNPCCPAGTVTSRLITQWGCEGQICQTATDNTPSVSVTNVQPNLLFSARTSSPRCFNTPAKQTIVIANPTAYAATNVKVQFGPVNTTPNFDNNQQLYLAGPYSYRIKNNGTPQNVNPTQLGTSTNACAPAGSATRMETTIPTIAPGDTAYVEFFTISCCVTTCNAAYTPRRWGYSGTYSGACPATTYTRTIVTGQNETYTANTFSLDAPLQVYDGQTFTMEVLSNGSSIPTLYNTAPAYLEYKYTIPSGFVFSGNTADFSFVDAGGITRAPNYFDFTGGVLTVRFNAPISFSQTRSRTLLKLKAQCGTSGNKTLGFQSQFVTDPTCATGCGALPPQCSTIVTELLCPGGTCAQGMNWATYDIQRITLGSPDNNNDSSPDASGTLDLAKTNRFIVGDTLQAMYTGTVKTSVAFPSFAYGYATASITNADEIGDARYSVQIIRGANRYTCTNLAATVTGTTTKVFTYDFSAPTLIAKSCLPTGFTFTNGDSVVVTAKYIANNLVPNSTVEEVLDITPEFYVATVANPTAAQQYRCGTRKGRMRHFDIANSTTTSNTNLNGCGSFQLVNNFNFSVGTSTSTTAGANVFTNEYRILQIPATSKTLAPPSTYTLNSVAVSLTRSVGFNTATTNLTVPSTYYFYSGDTLIVNLQQLFINGLLPYPEEGYSFRQTLTLTPIGAAGYVNSSSTLRTFTQYRNLPPLSVLTGTTVNGTTLSSVVSYNAPRLQLSTTQPTVNATSSSVSWDIVLSNVSTLSDAPFPWLTVKSKNGTFVLTQVQDITGTALTLSPNAGGLYQGSTSILKSGNRRYRITGLTNFCGRDTIEVFAGWSCAGLSGATTLGTAPYVSDTLSVFYEVKPSQISATITKVAGPFEMCQPFEVEVRIVAGQPTSVNTILANLELPTNNGKIGLDYIAASGTIEYPKGSAKRAFSAAGDNLILAAQDADNSTLPFNLGVIDPTNFGTGKSLAGVGSAPNNEAVIRFKLQPNCDLLSGQPFGLRIFGKDPCGNPTLGNSEFVQGFSVNIKGANTPYKTQVSLNLPSVNACANVNYPIGFNVLNLGLAATNDSGLVEVQLPAGYVPVAGSVVCNSAYCPPNLNGYTLVNLPNGGKSLTWKIAAGMPVGGEMDITFQVQVNADVACTTEQITVQTSLPFDVFCGTTLCPDFRVLTGLISDTITVKKAAFAYVSHRIAFTCSSATGEFTFKNTGAPLAAGNTTTVELYQDIDKSGTYTPGDVLLKTYTTTQAIATNQTVTLSGALPYSEPIPCPLVLVIKGCECTPFQKNLGGDFTYQNAGNDAVTCSNQPVQIGCSAGIAGYKYEWTPVGGALLSELGNATVSNPTITVVNNGPVPIVRKYLLSTTHASGCISTDEIEVTIQPAPISYDATLEKCDDGDGKVDFMLSDATPLAIGSQTNVQATYFATRANANNNVSPLGVTYNAAEGDSVFVRIKRTGENCFSIGKVTFKINPLPSASATAVNVNCFGTATGSVNLSVTGGTPNYTFVWSNGATAEDLTNVPAGTYNVTVADAKGCKTTANATVNQPTKLAASIVKTNVNCNGSASGNLNLTVTGGTPGYTFAWSNGATTEDISNVSIGIYSVNITDANGCALTLRDTILQPTPLQLTATQTDIKCNGAATGQINLTVKGGTGPYSYNWNTGSTSEDISGLPAGTYTITVTDKNGCQANTQVIISQPSALASSLAKTNVICFNQNNGALDLTVSGGNAPYTYKWSSGQTTQDIINLVAGTYRVVITDNNGCTKTDSAVITQPSSYFLFGGQTDVTCFGGSNGTVTLETITGSTPPYTFLWSNGATTRNLTNLSAGDYTVTVTDAQGCTVKGSNQIQQPDELKVEVTSNDVTCPDGSSGTLVSTVTGGTKPYRYEWRNAANIVVATTPGAFGLPIGSYVLTVTDANDCQKQTPSIIINQPPVISAQYESGNVSCFGGNDGKITITANGGTGALTYTWSDGGTGSIRTGMIAGTYSVEISDVNGCKISIANIILTQPSKLEASATSSAVNCFGSVDGRIDLTVTGGTLPYNFGWDNGSSSEDPQNLAAGTYNADVRDAKGCLVKASVTVTQPDSMKLSFTHQNAVCAGSSTGSIDLSVQGGIAPYSYQWSNGSASEDINSIQSGTYKVIVTDKNGCRTNGEVIVSQPDSLKATAASVAVKCFDGTNGSVDLTATGGTLPYSYSWSNSAASEDLQNVKAGTYTATVKDANQCEVSVTVSVSQPDSLHISFVKTNAQCRAKNDGTISVSVSGGIQPYSYAWSNGATTSEIRNLEAGTYSVTVTDSNQCQKQLSIVISEPDSLKIESLLTQVNCFGGSDGKIDISVFGGTQPYTYDWSNSATSQDVFNLKAGLYNVNVQDAQGCRQSLSVEIKQPEAVKISALSEAVLCKGNANGKIDVTVTGGVAPYQFTWAHGPGTEDITGLAAGTYTVVAQDANGCQTTLQTTLTEPDSLRISAKSLPIPCQGGTTDVDVTVNGGTRPYVYQWSNGQQTEDLLAVKAGSYSVTVTDSNRCVRTLSFVLTEPDSLKLSFTQQNVGCKDGTSGSIDLTVSGGTLPYTYLWSNGAVTQDIDYLKAGTYFVKVKDANGCADSLQIVVSQPDLLTLSQVSNNVKCKGDNSGSIDIQVKGGTQPYAYAWSNNATTQDLTNLPGGVYTLNVTDTKGCTAEIRVVIGEPDSLKLSLSPADVDCNGLSSGTILSTVSGGSQPYRYSWSNGSTLPNVFGLPAGTYSLTVTDTNNCVISASTTLGEPAKLAPNAEITHVSCFGGNDGSIDFNVMGGTGTYTYVWSNGATTQDISNLKAGVYQLIVKDGNKCEAVLNFTVTEPANPLKLTLTPTPPACYNGTDGQISMAVSGGTTPYTFSWSNGATTQELTGIGSGTYKVIVSDANGCTTTDSVTLTNPPLLSLAARGDTVCEGDTIQLSATFEAGGVIGWKGPVGYASAKNNPFIPNSQAYQAGSYIATVSKDGCTNTDTVQVVIKTRPTLEVIFAGCAPQSYFVRVRVSSQSRFSSDEGTVTDEGNNTFFIQNIPNNKIATLTVVNEAGCAVIQKIDRTICDANVPNPCTNNPAGPNAILCEPTDTHLLPKPVNGRYWVASASNPASASADTTGLVTGLTQNGVYHFILFSPLDNCADTVTVTRQALPRYEVVASSATCTGDSTNKDAFIQLTGFAPNAAFGLTLGSQYDVSTTIQPIPADGMILKNGVNPPTDQTYTVRVFSENGCFTDKTIVLKHINCQCTLKATATTQPIQCFGERDGAVDITVTGGTLPYAFTWSNTAVTEDLANVKAGNYTVTVKDSNFCEVKLTVNITQPDSMHIAVAKTNVQCHGKENGQISLTVSGGKAPYTFRWSNGATTPELQNLPAGTYTVTVTDSNLCQKQVSILITEPDSLIVTAAEQNVKCKGDQSGAIDISVMGGTQPYTYLWSNGAKTQDLANLPGGVYSVIVTDAKGCSADVRVVIGEPDSLKLLLSPADVDCNGLSSGTLLSTVSGGSRPYRYSWSNGSTLPGVFGLPAGSYTLTVTDSNNCVISASATLAEPAKLAPNAELVHVSCFGGSDGSIDFNVMGGTGTYTYAWSNGATTQDISNLKAGVYQVTVKDGNKCILEVSFTITQPASPLKTQLTPTLPTCHDGTDGSISTTISGATAPYSYSWSTGETTQNITGLKAGKYKVVVTDAKGCSVVDSISLSNPPLPALTARGDIVCEGDAIQLSATFEAGGSINWTGPANFTSTQTNPFIANAQLAQQGQYTATVSRGGCTQTDTVQVVVKTRPTLQVVLVNCVPNSYSVRVQVSPSAAFSSNEGTVTNEGNNTYFVQAIPNNKMAILKAVNAAGCEFIQKIDRTICNANLPQSCADNPAGPNAIVCEPAVTHSLPKPANGQYWVASASNPTSASVDTTGVVTGLNQNGVYHFILFSPLENCADTVTVTRRMSPRYGIMASPTTCAGNEANKDGFLQLTGFDAGALFSITPGNQYNAAATIQPIPADGIILKNLPNPLTDAVYTVRVFSENGCFTDKTIILKHTECTCPNVPCVPLKMKRKKPL